MPELLMPEAQTTTKPEDALIAPLEKIKTELQEILKKMKVAQQPIPVQAAKSGITT